MFRRRRGPVSFDVPPAVGCCPPRLHVQRATHGVWEWAVTRDGYLCTTGVEPTWARALAIGLTARDIAAVASTRRS